MGRDVALAQAEDMQSDRRLYSIGDLASETGVTHRALRLYEDHGLLAPQRIGNQRIYSHRDRARLILVQRGKRLGFSLADIKEMIDLRESSSCASNDSRRAGAQGPIVSASCSVAEFV